MLQVEVCFSDGGRALPPSAYVCLGSGVLQQHCLCGRGVSLSVQVIMRPTAFFWGCPVLFGLWVLLPPPPPLSSSLTSHFGFPSVPSSCWNEPQVRRWTSQAGAHGRAHHAPYAQWSVPFAASELRSDQVLQSQQVRCEVTRVTTAASELRWFKSKDVF